MTEDDMGEGHKSDLLPEIPWILKIQLLFIESSTVQMYMIV